MRLQVRHRTTYHYSEPVTLGHTEARLMLPRTEVGSAASVLIYRFSDARRYAIAGRMPSVNAVTRAFLRRNAPRRAGAVEAHSLMQIAPAEVELPSRARLTVAEVQKAFRDPQTEAQRLHRLFCLPSAYVPQLPELRDYA